jgi:hypothetical protein
VTIYLIICDKNVDIWRVSEKIFIRYKRDDINFPILNFPFICSNIPAAPAYGVYISQLIRYSRACGSYHNFFDRGLLLTRKLLNLGYVEVITSKVLRLPPWLGWPLWNICVTNDHGYDLLVVSRSRIESRNLEYLIVFINLYFI